MTTSNPLAAALNETLQSSNAAIFDVLSARGKAAFFPTKGILGQTAEAKGKSINATIGTALENDGSALVLECMRKHVRLSKDAFGYAPSFGLPALRETWKHMLSRKNPALADKAFSTPVVTAALTHGLHVAAHLFLDPGDTVVMPDLYWGNYNLILRHTFGVRFATHNTFADERFDVEAFAHTLHGVASEKVAVLLNFPNNPSGYTVTAEERARLCRTLLQAAESGKKIVALIDDAYFGLVYEEGVETQSLFAHLADLHPNVIAVKIDGATKEDYVWGLRVGFLTFAWQGATVEQLTAMEHKTAGVVRATISNAPNLAQRLLLAGYADGEYEREKRNKYALFKERYDEIRTLLAKNTQWRTSFAPLPFNSGYFMCVRPLGVASEQVRQRLLSHYDTGVIAQGDVIRIAFSGVPTDQLATLFANLHQAIEDVRGGTE